MEFIVSAACSHESQHFSMRSKICDQTSTRMGFSRSWVCSLRMTFMYSWSASSSYVFTSTMSCLNVLDFLKLRKSSMALSSASQLFLMRCANSSAS